MIAVGVMSESDGGAPSELFTEALQVSMGLGSIQQIKRVQMHHNYKPGLMSVPQQYTCVCGSGFEEV